MFVGDKYHDEVVKFRLGKKAEPFMRSIKSKSIGILLRLAGVMNLLRNATRAINSKEFPQYDNMINSKDIERAIQIVRYSVETSSVIAKVSKNAEVTKIMSAKNKEPVPEPENFTMEYLLAYIKVTRRILKKEEISVSAITRDKIYPHSSDESGAHIARKFLFGLVVLGLGELFDNGKIFKRYHPDDEFCADKDNLKKKWATLQIPLH